ncbi:MAG: LEA type 2 family protein [Candidatus Eisenbacteria bacterium]
MIRGTRVVLATALLTCLFAITSCSEIEEPIVTMTGVNLRGASLEGIVLELLLEVENPNGFGANIGELEYSVMLDNIKVGKGEQSDPIAVPADGTVEVAIPFTIVWSGVDKGLKKLLDGEEHEWRLKGSVRLSKGAMSRFFRFSEVGTFDAPKASDITIDF